MSVVVVVISIVALATLDSLVLSLGPLQIEIYPVAPLPMASTSTSTPYPASISTSAQVVRNTPPPPRILLCPRLLNQGIDHTGERAGVGLGTKE